MPISIHSSLFPKKSLRLGAVNKLLWTAVATLVLCQTCYRCYEMGLFGGVPAQSDAKNERRK